MPLEWSAGVELGLYLFVGSTVQILGIQGTSATRAAILVQLTTIIVPLLDSLLSKRAVSKSIWLACLLAFTGIVFISGGGDADVSSLLKALTSSDGGMGQLLGASFLRGDLLVCISAIFYSLHLVRLGQVAKRVNPVNLARVKSLTELVASASALAIALSFSPEGLTTASASASASGADSTVGNVASSLLSTGQQLQVFLEAALDNPTGNNQLFAVFAVLWNGIFSTALTTWAQTVGQQTVTATTANLLYSTQPIWAAAVSFVLLGDRVMSQSFLIGCAFLSTALFAAIMNSKGDDEQGT